MIDVAQECTKIKASASCKLMHTHQLQQAGKHHWQWASRLLAGGFVDIGDGQADSGQRGLVILGDGQADSGQRGLVILSNGQADSGQRGLVILSNGQADSGQRAKMVSTIDAYKLHTRTSDLSRYGTRERHSYPSDRQAVNLSATRTKTCASLLIEGLLQLLSA